MKDSSDKQNEVFRQAEYVTASGSEELLKARMREEIFFIP